MFILQASAPRPDWSRISRILWSGITKIISRTGLDRTLSIYSSEITASTNQTVRKIFPGLFVVLKRRLKWSQFFLYLLSRPFPLLLHSGRPRPLLDPELHPNLPPRPVGHVLFDCGHCRWVWQRNYSLPPILDRRLGWNGLPCSQARRRTSRCSEANPETLKKTGRVCIR